MNHNSQLTLHFFLKLRFRTHFNVSSPFLLVLTPLTPPLNTFHPPPSNTSPSLLTPLGPHSPHPHSPPPLIHSPSNTSHQLPLTPCYLSTADSVECKCSTMTLTELLTSQQKNNVNISCGAPQVSSCTSKSTFRTKIRT